MHKRPPIRRSLGFISIFLGLAVMIPVGVHCANDFQGAATAETRIQTTIRNRLAEAPSAGGLFCQGELLCGIQLLPQAYRKTDYRPLWIDASLRLEKAQALVDTIETAVSDGLNPIDYHLTAIRSLLADVCERLSATNGIPADQWADLDLMLTDAFLLYGAHLAAGRVNPETLHTDWIINPGPVDLVAALESAVTSGHVEAAVSLLRPTYHGYHQLREALARLRALDENGGWPAVPSDQTLRPDEHHREIEILRQRLTISGDLGPADPVQDATHFDPQLVEAVKRFQRRSGLAIDGVVGRDTFDMLNVSATQRIQQVMLNLERCRWLPRDLGRRHLTINTADFNLNAVDNGLTALTMRVVVGRPARRSPVFSANMSYLVINPFWNVPTTIAIKDILPELRKDVTYLTKRSIRVFESWQIDAPEIDPQTVDWHRYNANRFPFRLRQDPGPDNALGRIKFMFPNQFAVYLHDTPNRALFRRTQRDFSSGCIRVEAPLDLAAFVLDGQEAGSPEKLAELIDSGETSTIRLAKPLPVHLLYMTAWVDETGKLQFRNDIYQRDRDLQQAFNERRPSPPNPAGSSSSPIRPQTTAG